MSCLVLVMAMPVMFVALMTMSVVVATVFALIVAAAFVFMAISRCIVAVVPVIPHKIDAPATGSILSAMPSPVPFITGRYAYVDRRFIVSRPSLDNHRLLIDHLRLWITADINLTIETWLANADRNAHFRKSRSGHSREHHGKESFVHDFGIQLKG